MAKEILTMKNIVKEYVMGDEISRVLKGIDLTVRRGSSWLFSDHQAQVSLRL